MNTDKPLSQTETRVVASPPIALLIVMMVTLFVVMIAAGLVLANQIRLVEQNVTEQGWGADLIHTERQLLLIMGVMSVLLLLALGLVNWYVRRAEDERLELERNGTLFFTELKVHVGKLAEELDVEKLQLKALLGAMTEGVIYSEGTRIQYANRALSRLTGYTPEEVTQLIASDGQHPLANELDQLHSVILGAVNQGGMWQGQYTLHRKDGSEMEVGVVGAPINGENGHTRVLTVIRDASHERTMLAQKTRFISNTSHELKTPLANIRQRIHLLRKQPDKQEEHLQVMENVTSYMQQLLNEMLDVARFEQGVVLLDREDGVLEDLVSEAAHGYFRKAERRSITLNCALGETKHSVTVDHKRILQVFSNLISNAMNHTPDGGHIDVRVVEADDGMVAVEVEDNGAGIPPEMIENAFQPFAVASQGQVSGTVLGLSLSKEIIDLHGGDISVESEPGKGALYRVTLPVKAE
jgi:PAS domain S-box-containing protein